MVSQLYGESGGLELLPGGAHQADQGKAGLLRQQQGCSARPRSAGMLGQCDAVQGSAAQGTGVEGPVLVPKQVRQAPGPRGSYKKCGHMLNRLELRGYVQAHALAQTVAALQRH
ncbi:MAG: hypothetical protein FRX49_05697 [Trebouxia sp. A1-2]|nr:MAG: hypothetical protein FRX49_05697 [Trebouxia sp. A1-2]